MLCEGKIEIKDAGTVEMIASVEELEDIITLDEEFFPSQINADSYKLVRLIIGKGSSQIPDCEDERFSAGEFTKNGTSYKMLIGKFIFKRAEESQLHKEVNVFLYYNDDISDVNLSDITRNIAGELKEKL